jgi:hypothetical protein
LTPLLSYSIGHSPKEPHAGAKGRKGTFNFGLQKTQSRHLTCSFLWRMQPPTRAVLGGAAPRQNFFTLGFQTQKQPSWHPGSQPLQTTEPDQNLAPSQHEPPKGNIWQMHTPILAGPTSSEDSTVMNLSLGLAVTSWVSIPSWQTQFQGHLGSLTICKGGTGLPEVILPPAPLRKARITALEPSH